MNQEAFYGFFLGDALGAIKEFNSKATFTGKLDQEVKLNFRWVKKVLEVGSVTDDTEMLLTLYQLVRSGYTREKAIKAYINWANSSPSCIGVNTRKLFKGIKTVKGYENRAKKLLSQSSQSNGCLMRCLPLALLQDEKERKNIVNIDVGLTNPSSLCYEVVSLYVELMYYLLQGKKEEGFKYVENADKSDKVKDIWSKAHKGEKIVVSSKDKGWVLYPLYFAFLAMYGKWKDYHCFITYVIEQKGDTDTNAAVSGAVYACLYGLKGQEENIKVLLQEKKRPKEYQPLSFNNL